MEWNENQIKILDRLKLDFDPSGKLTDDQIVALENAVSEHLALHGIGVNDDVTPTGIICESILDAISAL